jgi:hypothetical protein
MLIAVQVNGIDGTLQQQIKLLNIETIFDS